MKKPLRNLHWTAQVTLTFLFKHMMAGVIGGIFLGFLLLYYDVSKLWTLISTSSDPWLFGAMLLGGFSITFGSIAMGWGIFSLTQERDDPPDNQTYY